MQNLRCVSQTVFCLFCKIMQKCSCPNFDMFANFCKLIESNCKVLQRGCNIFALSFGKRQQRICKLVAKICKLKKNVCKDFAFFWRIMLIISQICCKILQIMNCCKYFANWLQIFCNIPCEMIATFLQNRCILFAKLLKSAKILQISCNDFAISPEKWLQRICKLVARVLQKLFFS